VSAVLVILTEHAYSSLSSLVLFPNVPISLLSSIACRSNSSSSNAVRLFIVALLFALLKLASLCCLLSFFLAGSLVERELDLDDRGSRTGRYWEDFDLCTSQHVSNPSNSAGFTHHIPIPLDNNAMTRRPTQLAVILFRQHALVRQAHAPTMLPHLTAITLDEEVSQIIRNGFCGTSCQSATP
jgi:hypothetical protein